MKSKCISCAHCGMEPDCDAFCVQSDVIASLEKLENRRFVYGAVLNLAFQVCQNNFYVKHPLRAEKP